MTDLEVIRAVEQYYSGKFAVHGPTAQGVDWNSSESQALRFEQLLRVVDGEDDFSIVDYGCGYGALVGVLLARGARFAYRGFDLSEPMLEHARQQFGSRATFTADPACVERSDYAIASGIFNVRLEFDEERWLSYVHETVERLDQLCVRGFAFNMLTSYSDGDRMRRDLYYGDPCYFFDLCKSRYSRNVALLHDYGLYEFTIVVRKS
jgi:SAM-dependent methyltransferase